MITREDLYELVWSTPMIRAAEKFKVSGSYLARVCTELRGPRPERGYWAKLAVGKAPHRPALPEPLPGDPVARAAVLGLLEGSDVPSVIVAAIGALGYLGAAILLSSYTLTEAVHRDMRSRLAALRG